MTCLEFDLENKIISMDHIRSRFGGPHLNNLKIVAFTALPRKNSCVKSINGEFGFFPARVLDYEEISFFFFF